MSSRIPIAVAALGIFLLAGSVHAQTQVKDGPPILVGTGNSNDSYPKVARQRDGGFMSVWLNDRDLHGRVYTSRTEPIGSDFAVNPPAFPIGTCCDSFDGEHDVSPTPDDGFVVVYEAEDTNPYVTVCPSGACILSRRVSDEGTLGSQFLVQDSAPPYYQTANPEVAQNGAGDFMVVWEGIDAWSEGIFGRTMDQTGLPSAPTFQANEITDGYQGDGGEIDVAGAPEHGFVVAWYDEYEGIAFRRFDDAGAPLGPQALALDDDALGYDPQVAYLENGNFIVVWLVSISAASDHLEGRTYDAGGAPLGPRFTISTDADWSQPSVAGAPHDHFVVVWTAGDNLLKGQIIDEAGNLVGAQLAVSDSPGFQSDVDTDLEGNFTVVWKDGSSIMAQNFSVPEVGVPLLGKKLKIKDKVPDDPEKRKIQWIAKDPSISLPLAGSPSDPTCNGDPAGTVKASIRFFSDDSGHDTGTIDLPCQWWFRIGQGAKLSYQYKDLKLFDGPCKFIQLKSGKLIKATCSGRSLAATLDYDLEIGTAEGTVRTELVLGSRRFCTAIPTFKTKDGSDGKLFLGKDGLAPASCP